MKISVNICVRVKNTLDMHMILTRGNTEHKVLKVPSHTHFQIFIIRPL